MEESQTKIQELKEQLAAEQAKSAELSTKLNGIMLEQQLIRRLSDAGASDIESALLLAKSRLKSLQQADMDDCIEQLRREKSHLFAVDGSAVVVPGKTAGARQRAEDVTNVLAQAADKAAATGSRRDLQEYLKLRRNYM